MKYFLVVALIFSSSFVINKSEALTSNDETDEIYWETPQYLSKLQAIKSAGKTQYVYHWRENNFKGNWIIPLNMMPNMEGYSEIYNNAIAKYKGREELLKRVIPTLRCLWNDVIFLSPLHPHKQYKEYKKIGFASRHLQFFKIPIEILEEGKRVTVWKWLSYKKYPPTDPIHEAIDSYCGIDFSHYQELDDLPHDTKEFYMMSFNPMNPAAFPRYTFYRIPHILCQDPINILDERITIIDWADEIEENDD